MGVKHLGNLTLDPTNPDRTVAAPGSAAGRILGNYLLLVAGGIVCLLLFVAAFTMLRPLTDRAFGVFQTDDPQTGWTIFYIPTMPVTLTDYVVCPTPVSGEVYVFGGALNGGKTPDALSRDIYAFDLSRRRWRMHWAKTGIGMLGGSCVYASGGKFYFQPRMSYSKGGLYRSAEIYSVDTQTGEWREVASLPGSLGDDTVLVNSLHPAELFCFSSASEASEGGIFRISGLPLKPVLEKAGVIHSRGQIRAIPAENGRIHCLLFNSRGATRLGSAFCFDPDTMVQNSKTLLDLPPLGSYDPFVWLGRDGKTYFMYKPGSLSTYDIYAYLPDSNATKHVFLTKRLSARASFVCDPATGDIIAFVPSDGPEALPSPEPPRE